MVNRVIFYAFVGYKITLVNNEEGKIKKRFKKIKNKTFFT